MLKAISLAAFLLAGQATEAWPGAAKYSFPTPDHDCNSQESVEAALDAIAAYADDQANENYDRLADAPEPTLTCENAALHRDSEYAQAALLAKCGNFGKGPESHRKAGLADFTGDTKSVPGKCAAYANSMVPSN